HMVENRPLIAALVEQARNDGISLYPFAVRDCAPTSARPMPGFAGAGWGQNGSGRVRSGEKAENAQPDLVRHVQVELADGARLSGMQPTSSTPSQDKASIWASRMWPCLPK